MSRRDDAVLAAASGKHPNSRGWVRGNCPFCEAKIGKPDKKQCLVLVVTVGKWWCYRCGSAGLISLMPDDLGSFRVDAEKNAADELAALEPPDGYTPLFDGKEFSFAGDFMREYLTGSGRTASGERKRELPEATCRAAKIGAVFDGCGEACEPRCTRCKLRGRIVVPILNADGSGWRGWSARATFPTSRKYLYPSGMHRADLLYNHRALHVPTEQPVFVVEGVFDALYFWPDAVALLGKASREQKEALAGSQRPVVVVLDGDAWREGEALATLLRVEGVRAGWIRMDPGVDPDELPRRELEERAVAALP